MRHRKRRYKIGIGIDHRQSLLRNLVVQLITHHQITTTLTKAKALRPFFDKLVTLAKKNTLHSQRLLVARLGNNKTAAFNLIHKIIPQLSNRQSGYTTLKRLTLRKGDTALQAKVAILFDHQKLQSSSKTSTPTKNTTSQKPTSKKTTSTSKTQTTSKKTPQTSSKTSTDNSKTKKATPKKVTKSKSGTK